MPRDQYDEALDRIEKAGIIRRQGRIRGIHGDDQFPHQLTEPLANAVRADPDVLPLIRWMVDASEFDRAVLSAILENWQRQIERDNPHLKLTE